MDNLYLGQIYVRKRLKGHLKGHIKGYIKGHIKGHIKGLIKGHIKGHSEKIEWFIRSRWEVICKE